VHANLHHLTLVVALLTVRKSPAFIDRNFTSCPPKL